MYRSIRNSHIPPPPGIPRAFDPLPCPGRGEFDGPQRTWGGAFDRNTRGVGNLIRCLDFMFRAALRIKTARLCLQTLKQLPDPSVIIVEQIFNVAGIMFLFVTFGKTLETDISAQIISDFRRESGPEVGHLTTEFSLDVGHLNGFLAPGWGIWPQLNWKVQMPGGLLGGRMCEFRIDGYITIINHWHPNLAVSKQICWKIIKNTSSCSSCCVSPSACCFWADPSNSERFLNWPFRTTNKFYEYLNTTLLYSLAQSTSERTGFVTLRRVLLIVC